VQQLGQEKREAERQYQAALGTERSLRLQEQGEWERRVDRVGGWVGWWVGFKGRWGDGWREGSGSEGREEASSESLPA
jgi:hypothetical protein